MQTANNLFLYERLNVLSEAGAIDKALPDSITGNLNPEYDIRDYQTEAFARFIYCYKKTPFDIQKPIHLLFNMATGSGKTLIMAGLILYLYEQGYRNFLFFVNSKNIIEKTKDNFINKDALKYLFNQEGRIDGLSLSINEVENFEDTYENDINICFTTIQQLHLDMTIEKENALTPEHFEKHKIVLLADEAHHLNVRTRTQQQLFETWEDTVETIFNAHRDNLLLEFTATHDYEAQSMVEIYRDKVIYRYDLIHFREDKFSKEIDIVRTNFHLQERMLQAIILSYYKQTIATKHNIHLKPVILFKAQRTIAQSKETKELFHQLIDRLDASHINRIREQSEAPILQQAFAFFESEGITDEALATRLREAFQPNYCLSVNDDKEAEANQIRVNTLEKDDNPIRAVFAVHKLNEGWDVRNLFDIVRCYETRDTRFNRPGRTTIAEAQLIGRGARYYPFTTDEYEDKYRRKFDRKTEHELRVLETLHYHSINNPQYISEIRKALIDEGLIDETVVKRNITLKESFRDTDFYENGIVWINERKKREYRHVQSFDDIAPLTLRQKNHRHIIYAGEGGTTTILEDNMDTTETQQRGKADRPVCKIEQNIVFEAIARNPFYRFNNLKQYFPNLTSMQEFRTSENYLGGLTIEFRGNTQLLATAPREKLIACCNLLHTLETELKKHLTQHIGTKNFKPHQIKTVFLDKTLNFNAQNTSEDYEDNEYNDIVQVEGWFAFKGAFYGTSEERGLVKMLANWWQDTQEHYETFYLIRNEQHIGISNFDDGRMFYPDYVMFLKKRNGDTITYEVFVEPKGTHLQDKDRWKENFLKEIKTQADTAVIAENWQYRILGVGQFYNQNTENHFRDELNQTLQIDT